MNADRTPVRCYATFLLSTLFLQQLTATFLAGLSAANDK